MPVKDQAAYMREYRAKQKALTWGDVLPDPLALADMVTSELRAENARLTEEVARLKRELAQRTTIRASGDGVQIVSAETRRARQAVIDAALAKVNRTARK